MGGVEVTVEMWWPQSGDYTDQDASVVFMLRPNPKWVRGLRVRRPGAPVDTREDRVGFDLFEEHNLWTRDAAEQFGWSWFPSDDEVRAAASEAQHQWWSRVTETVMEGTPALTVAEALTMWTVLVSRADVDAAEAGRAAAAGVVRLAAGPYLAEPFAEALWDWTVAFRPSALVPQMLRGPSRWVTDRTGQVQPDDGQPDVMVVAATLTRAAANLEAAPGRDPFVDADVDFLTDPHLDGETVRAVCATAGTVGSHDIRLAAARLLLSYQPDVAATVVADPDVDRNLVDVLLRMVRDAPDHRYGTDVAAQLQVLAGLRTDRQRR